MPRTRSYLIALLSAGTLPFAAGMPLEAQDAGGAAAFPRSIVASYLAGDVDRIMDHLVPEMRRAASRAELREAMSEIITALGAETAMLSEQLFDHPDGGTSQVYVRGIRHANTPEMFWIVIFSPENRQVYMVAPQARQVVTRLFPQIRLP